MANNNQQRSKETLKKKSYALAYTHICCFISDCVLFFFLSVRHSTLYDNYDYDFGDEIGNTSWEILYIYKRSPNIIIIIIFCHAVKQNHQQRT